MTATGRAALLLAVLAVVLVVPRLGHRQIVGSHEAVFPVVARDIVERGVWFDAHLRGVPYRNKPPLYPWAIAAVSWPGGRVTEVTARVPVALASIGTVLGTFLLGMRLFGRRAGVWAALVLATSALAFDQAVATIPDVPMIFFGVLAAIALWSLGNDGGRTAAVSFYACVGLSVLCKGIPGLLPVAVALVWLGVDGGRAGLRRLVSGPGLLVLVVAVALWVVPYLLLGARSYVTNVIWGDALRAHVGGPRLASLGRQFGYAVLGLLPWTLLLPVAAVAAVRARRDRAVAFTLCVFVVPAVFVLGVQQQRLRYLLPLIPGAALLVAWWLDREATRAPRRHRALGAAALVTAIIAAGALPFAVSALGVPVSTPRWATIVAALAVLVLGAAVFAGFWTGRVAATIPVVVAVTAALLLGGGWLVDEAENHAWDFRAVAAEVARVRRPLAVAALADDHELLQVDFYLGRSLPPLRSPAAVGAHLGADHGAVVMEAPRWQTVAGWLGRAAEDLRADSVGAGVMVVTDAER